MKQLTVAGVCLKPTGDHVETVTRALYLAMTMKMRSWRSPKVSLGREVGNARDGTAGRYCWFAISLI